MHPLDTCSIPRTTLCALEQPRTITVLGKTYTLPQFRASVPVYACPPRTGGEALITDVPAQMHRRIERAIEEDLTALDFMEAVQARTMIDEVCEQVAGMLEPFEGHVFYDPGDRQFYAYPA